MGLAAARVGRLHQAVLVHVSVPLQRCHGPDARHRVVLDARVPRRVHAVLRKLLRRQCKVPRLGVAGDVDRERHAPARRDGNQTFAGAVIPRFLRAVNHGEVESLVVPAPAVPRGRQGDLQRGQRRLRVRDARRGGRAGAARVRGVRRHVQRLARAARPRQIALLAWVTARGLAHLNRQSTAAVPLRPTIEAASGLHSGQCRRGSRHRVEVVEPAGQGELGGSVRPIPPIRQGLVRTVAGAGEHRDLQFAPIVRISELHARATREPAANPEALRRIRGRDAGEAHVGDHGGGA
mmetsp:Transcript_89685/g.274564  ORF Transcript_89685/g.274564 Transcript_89685/m.274564 type:complete len:293 (-) Transcript_89685:327-1205(-)